MTRIRSGRGRAQPDAAGLGRQPAQHPGGHRAGPRRRRAASSACRSCASPATAARTPSTRPACSDTALDSARRDRCRPPGAWSSRVGLPVLHQQRACSTRPAWLVDGRIVGFVAKRFLAGDGLHYEPRWFKPWPRGRSRRRSSIDGQTYPIGDLVFDCGGVKIGFEICEDAWVAQRPGGDMALHGVDVILNPSASHFAFGKFEVRKRFVLEGSRAFSVSYVYANLSATRPAGSSTTAAP